MSSVIEKVEECVRQAYNTKAELDSVDWSRLTAAEVCEFHTKYRKYFDMYACEYNNLLLQLPESYIPEAFPVLY
jgi:hypothetical protein